MPLENGNHIVFILYQFTGSFSSEKGCVSQKSRMFHAEFRIGLSTARPKTKIVEFLRSRKAFSGLFSFCSAGKAPVQTPSANKACFRRGRHEKTAGAKNRTRRFLCFTVIIVSFASVLRFVFRRSNRSVCTLCEPISTRDIVGIVPMQAHLLSSSLRAYVFFAWILYFLVLPFLSHLRLKFHFPQCGKGIVFAGFFCLARTGCLVAITEAFGAKPFAVLPARDTARQI